jgi:hypothetical protein
MTGSRELPEPAEVLYRIKRGLAGYVSSLAACEMNESFSEYVLYEPILRILTARQYVVECEVKCPGIPQPRAGDRKRLDFVATRGDSKFALEVKWAQSRSIDVANDHTKLSAFVEASNGASRAFLCVFGRKSHIGHLRLAPGGLPEVGKPVVAEFGRIRYGCRIFEVRFVATRPQRRRRGARGVA